MSAPDYTIRSTDRLKELMGAYFKRLGSGAYKVAWCTSVGPAELLRSFGFEVYFPAEWSTAEGDDRRCQDAPKCLISRESEFMLVREQTMARGPDALAAELDAVVAGFENATADAEFVSREPFTTASGLPGEILRYSIEQGRVSVKELWAADGDQAVSVAFITWNEGFAAMEPVADYVFSTLARTDAAAE